MKRNYLIIVLSALLLAACSSGKNRLENGDYDVAVYKAVKRLQQKPDHKKAEKVLREAYALAVNGHMAKIEYSDKSNSLFKYDRMVDEYISIARLNNAIRKYPKYAKLITLTDVTDELLYSKNQAAEAHLREGHTLLNMGVKQRARDAYFQFLEANRFVPGFVSIEQLDKAQEAGTLNVVLEFSNNKNFFRDFNTDVVYSNVLSSFRGTRYRFLRVIEPGELDSRPDEIIQIELDEAHIGGVDFSRNVVELTKNDVYMGEAETDSGEIVEVYGSVSADYIEFCKTINTRARLMIQRVDGKTAGVVQRHVIPSTYFWTEKWATYRGDKRALSQEQLDFARRSEPSVPNPDWLFAQTTRPLVGQSIDFLRGQFSYLR